MLSISSGHSAEYLTGQVAQGRESYYLNAETSGEPPGRWWGAGAQAFGLQGEVDAEAMHRLYAEFIDPRDGKTRLGQAPGRYKSADDILAGLLAAEPDALPERVAELRRQADRQQRQPVAFLDLTFSPVKSVTVLHTAYARAELDAQRDGDQVAAVRWASKRQAVERAIWEGSNAMLAHMSERAGYSRTGRHGAGAGRWVDAHDWTVASFFQHDSRDHDPQLHIHNAVLNRVICPDGQVRTLDSQAIHRYKQAAGAIGERVMQEAMTRSLGVTWSLRPDGVAHEVAGVDQAALDLFAERSGKISRALQVKVVEFERHFGREPSALEMDRMRRQASMATRRAKEHTGETRGDQLDRWDEQLRAEIAGGLRRIATSVGADQVDQVVAQEWSPSGVLAEAVAACQQSRVAWGRSELVRQILLALPATLGVTRSDQVADLAEALADQVMADADQVVRVSGTELAEVPDELRLTDGRSAYAAPGGPRYATRSHVVAEQALRRAAVVRGRVAASAAESAEWLRAYGDGLGSDQGAAVRGLLTSGAAMSVLVGPAGTGKTHTLGYLTKAWGDLVGGRVVGLTTSQIAAEVLSGEGVPAMNTARWLAGAAIIGRNDLVVVDEASMVDTEVMREVCARVEVAGARMILTGDPRQLAAVGAGGAMAMLADGTAETYTLTEVRRFVAEWERTASLHLRDREPDALVEYDRRGRLVDAGTAEAAGLQAARAYLGDVLAGHDSLVVAVSNREAASISATIRDELVVLGRVEQRGVMLGLDGNVAGVGDLVQARRNDWQVRAVNRRRYTVEAVEVDGGLAVKDEAGRRLRLSPGYVAEHLALGYASTAHSAQGVTVDTCHAVATSSMTPEALYVAMSRGRQRNTAYVATQPETVGAPTGETHQRERLAPLAVLADVMDREADEEQAALVQAAEDARRAGSMATIHARYEDAMRLIGRWRTDRWLDELTGTDVLAQAEREALASDQGTEQLSRLLRSVELAGWDARATLQQAVEGRSLDGAKSLAQVLHHRITEQFADLAPREPWREYVPSADIPEDWRRYLGELRELAANRCRELGTVTAEQAPQWAVESLGPIPVDEVDRLEWEHRAGQVAGYREAAEWVDEARPVGPAPGHSATERRALWHAAWSALGRPEAGEAEADLSEGNLRVRVKAWEREQAWAPRWVDDEMRATGQAAARHQQDGAILRARAEATADEAERQRLLDEAADRAALAETLAEVEQGLAAVADARAAWYVETAVTREAAERARAELAARGRDIGAEPDRVTAAEWLAEHDRAMAAEDPHRVVTEVDVVDEQAEADRVAADAISGRPRVLLDTATVDEAAKTRGRGTGVEVEREMPEGVPTAAETEAAVVAAREAEREIVERQAAELAARQAESARLAAERAEDAERAERWVAMSEVERQAASAEHLQPAQLDAGAWG